MHGNILNSIYVFNFTLDGCIQELEAVHYR